MYVLDGVKKVIINSLGRGIRYIDRGKLRFILSLRVSILGYKSLVLFLNEGLWSCINRLIWI